MYDRVNLPESPAWARRLIDLNKLTGLEIPESVHKLAEADKLTRDDLSRFKRITNNMIQTIQYIVDWNYRCVLVDDSFTATRSTAIMAACHSGQKPILILSPPSSMENWATAIAEIVGKDEKVLTLMKRGPTNIEGYNWIITSIDALYGIKLSDNMPGLLIFDNVEKNHYYGSAYSDDYLTGICREIPHVLVIQPLKSIEEIGTPEAEYHYGVGGSKDVKWVVQNCLGIVGKSWNLIGSNNATSVKDYTIRKNYRSVARTLSLGLMGVSTHLVADAVDSHLIVVESTLMLPGTVSQSSNRAQKAIASHFEKEAEVERRLNDYIESIIQSEVEANDFSVIENDLQSSAWAKVKSMEINKFLSRKALSASRSLVVTNHIDIKRNVMLASSALDLDVPSDDGTNVNLAKFLYPNKSHRRYLQTGRTLNGGNPVGLVRDFQNVNEDILEVVDYLIIGETPKSKEEHQQLKALATAYNITLVYFTMLGTFEEYLMELVQN